MIAVGCVVYDCSYWEIHCFQYNRYDLNKRFATLLILQASNLWSKVHHMLLINRRNLWSRFILFSMAFWTLSMKSWIAVSVDFPCVESFDILVFFFFLHKKLIWYSVTFLTFKKELLDNYGYFLIPFLMQRCHCCSF